MKKKELYIRVRTSLEEKREFERNALKRGVTVSDYVKEQCIRGAKGNIYDKDVQEALESVWDLLYYKVKEHCEDEEFVKVCKEGAERIWLCL